MRKSLIRTISKLELELRGLENEGAKFKNGQPLSPQHRQPQPHVNNNNNGNNHVRDNYKGKQSVSEDSSYSDEDDSYDEDDEDDLNSDEYHAEEERQLQEHRAVRSVYDDIIDEIGVPKGKRVQPQQQQQKQGILTNSRVSSVDEYYMEYIEYVIFAQKHVRKWLAMRRYKELVLFYQERAKIVNELVSNENTYVLTLSYLCTYFIVVLKEEFFRYKQESFIFTLFKALENIRRVHAGWFNLLQSRANLYNVRLEIADVLLELLPCLDNYHFFCSNYLHLIHWVQEQAKSPNFIKIEKKCCDELMQSKGVSTNLQSLLSIPLTNLREYNTILEELAKYTHPNTKEYTAVSTTLSKIQEVASLATSAVKEFENRHKVLVVQESFAKHGHAPVLAIPNRILMHEGNLIKLCRKIAKKRYFWLFNDIIVYGKEVGGSGVVGSGSSQLQRQFKYHRHMPLPNSKFVDLPDDPSRQPHAFQMVTANKSFIVFAFNGSDKKIWLENHAKALEIINRRNSEYDRRVSKVLAPVWFQDNMSNNCMMCGLVFTMVKRRHHCRKCGRLVCGQCSPKKMVLANLGKAKRVCTDCFVQNSEPVRTDKSKKLSK